MCLTSNPNFGLKCCFDSNTRIVDLLTGVGGHDLHNNTLYLENILYWNTLYLHSLFHLVLLINQGWQQQKRNNIIHHRCSNFG